MNNIIVLSGGGVRGILQARILRLLQDKGLLNDLKFIIGSSVGAINGAILASGIHQMSYIDDNYESFLKQAFKKKVFRIPPFPIYDKKNFINVWNDMMGLIYMKDLKIPLITTSVELTEKKMCFFKSYKDEFKDDIVLKYVIRSFAAPLYFGTIKDSVEKKVYMDGGCGADNIPIFEGLFEAIKLGLLKDDLNIIIVGTGYSDISETYEDLSKENNIQQVLDFMNPKDGGLARSMARSRQIDSLTFLAKSMGFSFQYYDIQIDKKLDKMDGLQYMEEYKRLGTIAAEKPLAEYKHG